jgi:hypothetical protein
MISYQYINVLFTRMHNFMIEDSIFNLKLILKRMITFKLYVALDFLKTKL